MDRGNAYKDYVNTQPLESTYNGLNTLREKTMIALRTAGGVMLFDINEDTYDETSVVSMVDETLAAMGGLSKYEQDNYIWVVIDNKPLYFGPKDGFGVPFIDKNNRTLLPVRKLVESMGAKVNYTTDKDGKVASVSAELNGVNVIFNIGSKRYSVNGKNQTMDTVALIKDGRTYIPARPALEAFGYEVSYSQLGKSVYAMTKGMY
jgi:hypothetical protein